MVLDATTDNLEILLDKAITTNNPSFAVFYNEYDSTSVTPTSSYGITNGTASVNLIPAPSSGRQRQLRYCAINNADTADVGVIVRFNNSGSFRNLLYTFLRVNESIQYSEEMGWRIYTANGEEKVAGYNETPNGSINLPEWFGATNATTVQALTNTTAFCTYLGRADRSYTSIKLRYRVTTALTATVSWAEAAIYKGTPTLYPMSGPGTTMTRLAWTSVSGQLNTLGQTTTTIPMTGSIAIGDDLWAVFSNSTTGTVASLRAGVADTGSAGFLQTSASCQPSANATIVGTVNASTPMLWMAWEGV